MQNQWHSRLLLVLNSVSVEVRGNPLAISISVSQHQLPMYIHIGPKNQQILGRRGFSPCVLACLHVAAARVGWRQLRKAATCEEEGRCCSPSPDRGRGCCSPPDLTNGCRHVEDFGSAWVAVMEGDPLGSSCLPPELYAMNIRRGS